MRIFDLGWPRPVLALVICTGLAACARDVRALHSSLVTISGGNTAQLDPDAAKRKVLVEAAAITVDHGYRYFGISEPIRPGADVMVHLYRAGEINEKSGAVWDADAVAAGQLSEK